MITRLTALPLALLLLAAPAAERRGRGHFGAFVFRHVGRRQDRPRRDGVHQDAARRQLEAQRLGERDGLGGGARPGGDGRGRRLGRELRLGEGGAGKRQGQE